MTRGTQPRLMLVVDSSQVAYWTALACTLLFMGVTVVGWFGVGPGDMSTAAAGLASAAMVAAYSRPRCCQRCHDVLTALDRIQDKIEEGP